MRVGCRTAHKTAITTASCSFKGGVDPLMIKAMSVIGTKRTS
jgi:hypothetical protein